MLKNLVLIVIALSFSLVSCNKDDDPHPIVGAWITIDSSNGGVNFEETIIFYASKKVDFIVDYSIDLGGGDVYSDIIKLSGTYSVSNNVVKMELDDEVIVVSYKIDGDALTLTFAADGREVVYTRIE
ncbi:hypothetical protein KEM09_05555 [Carboxylicivirga mesophila]|uniref:Lipocalin-like domain-containing protein n=1 Tax=Carboxylicivirga mesophila TaxID=1166478 RepID=A0ABS5K791_9BACT|nr:hypothetical protein [Carboxylicivirga mesophila]MBS2210853.1 hypothetical protein [Carboxylicivirga mesophila]